MFLTEIAATAATAAATIVVPAVPAVPAVATIVATIVAVAPLLQVFLGICAYSAMFYYYANKIRSEG